MKKELKLAVGWSITGEHGMYEGFWFTRNTAIDYHIKAKGMTWAECKRRGDRAIKILLYEA